MAPSSPAANMLTKQARESNTDKKSLHSQAAAHLTNAKERYTNTGTRSTVDTDHKHQQSVQRTQKEYSTEPMLSQVNRLMSHGASQRTFSDNKNQKKAVFTPACGESWSGSDFFDRLEEKSSLTTAGKRRRVKIPGAVFLSIRYSIYILDYIHYTCILANANLYININSKHCIYFATLTWIFRKQHYYTVYFCTSGSQHTEYSGSSLDFCIFTVSSKHIF